MRSFLKGLFSVVVALAIFEFLFVGFCGKCGFTKEDIPMDVFYIAGAAFVVAFTSFFVFYTSTKPTLIED